jgi:hypothetical protein
MRSPGMSLAYLVLPFRWRRGRDNGLPSMARRTLSIVVRDTSKS